MQDKSNRGLSGLQCLNVFQKKITILGAKSVKKNLPLTGFEPVTPDMADFSANQYTKLWHKDN